MTYCLSYLAIFCVFLSTRVALSCTDSCQDTYPDCTFSDPKYVKDTPTQANMVYTQKCTLPDGTIDTYTCWQCYPIPQAEPSSLNQVYGAISGFISSSPDSSVGDGNKYYDKKATAVTGSRGSLRYPLSSGDSSNLATVSIKGAKIYSSSYDTSTPFGYIEVIQDTAPTANVPFYVYFHGMTNQTSVAVQNAYNKSYVWALKGDAIQNDAIATTEINKTVFRLDTQTGKYKAKLFFYGWNIPSGAWAFAGFSVVTPNKLASGTTSAGALDFYKFNDSTAWSISGNTFQTPSLNTLANNKSASLVTVVNGPATLDFKWQLTGNSFSNKYVNFTLTIDGSIAAYINQSNAGQLISKSINISAGSHVIEWELNKNGDFSAEPATSRGSLSIMKIAAPTMPPISSLLLGN